MKLIAFVRHSREGQAHAAVIKCDGNLRRVVACKGVGAEDGRVCAEIDFIGFVAVVEGEDAIGLTEVGPVMHRPFAGEVDRLAVYGPAGAASVTIAGGPCRLYPVLRIEADSLLRDAVVPIKIGFDPFAAGGEGDIEDIAFKGGVQNARGCGIAVGEVERSLRENGILEGCKGAVCLDGGQLHDDACELAGGGGVVNRIVSRGRRGLAEGAHGGVGAVELQPDDVVAGATAEAGVEEGAAPGVGGGDIAAGIVFYRVVFVAASEPCDKVGGEALPPAIARGVRDRVADAFTDCLCDGGGIGGDGGFHFGIDIWGGSRVDNWLNDVAVRR